MRREICSEMQFEFINNKGMILTSINAVLQRRVDQAATELRDFGGTLAGKIIFHLSGDHGGGMTKLCISLAQHSRPNSASNQTLIAMFPGQDSRENLENFCKKVWSQIEEIKLINLSGIEREVVW